MVLASMEETDGINMNDPQENRISTPMPRRSFLKKLVGVVVGLTGVLFAAPVARYLIPAGSEEGEGFLTKADGEAVVESDIKEGSSFVGLSKDGPVIVIRRGGKLTAFSAVCTHLGCLVKWLPNEEVFFCPCHAGKFDANGVNISGPPPSPLAAFAVEMDSAGHVIIKQI